jgi:hypothetical protein
MRYNNAGGEAMSRNSGETTSAEWLSSLSAAEASQFTRLLQAYPAASGQISDDEMQALLALVHRYTAERVRQAIAQAAEQGPVSIERLQTVLNLEDPLLAQVVRLCEAERIEPVTTARTPLVSQMLAELVDEFADLYWWQEAVRRAVAANRRRLSTVERILRDYQETGSWEPPWEQKAAEKQRGKAGKARRGSPERGTAQARRPSEERGTPHWDADELARRRAQLPQEEWDEPPD